MCGIAGFVDKTIKNKEKVIKDMAERIKYRGPDGEVYFIDDEVDDRYFLSEKMVESI